MKIGILTFHFGINYGAVLQCYALQEALTRMGHQAVVIDYIPDRVRQASSGLFRRALSLIRRQRWDRGWRMALCLLRHRRGLRSAFAGFRERYLHLTPRCDSRGLAGVCAGLDAIAVGSDQVWGAGYHADGCYFLSGLPAFEGRRIAYAPCCPSDCSDSPHDERVRGWLERFDAIGVRDDVTARWIGRVLGQVPQLVPDPTLLCDFESVRATMRKPYEHYIFAYILGEAPGIGHAAAARILREKFHLPIVAVVLCENNLQLIDWADRVYCELAPENWLHLLRSADFVYTDSYHGVIFSLKNHVPFWAYYIEERRASRLVELSKTFGLEASISSDIAGDAAAVSVPPPPDFERIDRILDEQRRCGTLYLQMALKDEKA